MTATQAAHIWRVLLELEGRRDFEIEIRKAPREQETERTEAS